MGDSNLCILSYDVDGRDRSTASRVCHLIFGRKNTTTAAGISKAYEQAGFIHRSGVVWVGQSVLILPQRDAMDLRRRLEGMGVSVGLGQLTIGDSDLAVFRRRRRRGAPS